MNTEGAVFIIDDDPSVLRSLERLIRSAGFPVRAYESAGQFLETGLAERRGCLILDLQLPELSGLQLQQALIEEGDTLPVIFLTGHGDIPASVTAIKAGAVDFLTKPWREETLLAAVSEALARDEREFHVRQEQAEFDRRIACLTPRERQVLAHVVAGRLNKQIAFDLGICVQTIKVHRGRVMEKLQVKRLTDLVRIVEKAGSVFPVESGRYCG